MVQYENMLDPITQVAIALLGTCSIILVAKKNKWGFVFGLAGQPFWLITSFINHQWGIFLVAIIYTISWIFGIREWFFKNKK